MRDHIKVLGILNIVLGSLTALLGLIVLLGSGTVAAVVLASMHANGDYGDAATAGPFIAMAVVGVAIFFFALGLPSILGGWGLLHYRPWSRILMIVISVLNLFHFPIGTALGVYGLWVLLSEGGRRILESGGAVLNAPATPGYYAASPAYSSAPPSGYGPPSSGYGPPPPPPATPSV